MNPPPRGRSMRPTPLVRPDAPADPPPEADDPPKASPFAGFGPGAGSMGEQAEQNRSQSLGILAIVAGLGVAGAAVAIMVVLFLLLLFLYETVSTGPSVAQKGTDVQHIRDTGSATPTRPDPVQSIGRSGHPGDPSGPGDGPPAPTGPPPGPVTVIVPSKMMFLSIEIGCPKGFRNRGSFTRDGKTKSATVPNVPGDQRCTVTFQGSEPATTYATGNQTLSCTFDPVVCNQVR